MNVGPVIDRFGGVRALARRLSLPASTVQYWKETGRIPSKRLGRVLEVGQELDPPLRAADLFPDVKLSLRPADYFTEMEAIR